MNQGGASKKQKAAEPPTIDLVANNHLNLDIILAKMDSSWQNSNAETRKTATLKALEETVLLYSVVTPDARSHISAVQEQLRMLIATLRIQ
jgi:hypothetical protein